jgi:hypothetical protein
MKGCEIHSWFLLNAEGPAEWSMRGVGPEITIDKQGNVIGKSDE